MNNKWLDGAPGSTAHSISRPRLNSKLQGSGYGGDGSGLRGHSGYYDADGHLLVNLNGRNQWNYWVINTANYSEAHFAVFPEEIPRRAILLSTSEKGQCPKCGKAWVRVVERTSIEATRGREPCKITKGLRGQPDRDLPGGWCPEVSTLGWQPACKCNAGDPAPQVVLDPFMGAGTTAVVAVKLNRSYFGIEINKEYCEMARRRVAQTQPPLFVI